MNHNLEQFGEQAAFVSANGITPWHRLGTVFEGEKLTTESALEIAHLSNWNVRKSPLTTAVGDLVIPVPDKFAMIRDNPFVPGKKDVLGVTGNYYTAIQNEAHADLLNALVDESEGVIETAGSLNDGKKVFITIKLPQAMQIGGSDEVDLYIIATNSHDGSSNFEFLVSPVRVVCQNTLTAAFSSSKSRFGIRHTSSSGDKIQQARETLGLTWKYVEDFEREAQKLIDASLTNTQFEDIIRDLYPAPKEDAKRANTLWDEKFEALTDVYYNDDTQQNIYGTRWGGYQAVTRYLDHVAPVAGEKSREDDGWVAQARAERTATDMRFEAQKNAAFKAFAAI